MDAVCIIAKSLYPNDPLVRRQAEALERAGITVDVICLFIFTVRCINDMAGSILS